MQQAPWLALWPHVLFAPCSVAPAGDGQRSAHLAHLVRTNAPHKGSQPVLLHGENVAQVGARASFESLGLQAVAQLVQQPVHRPFADTVTGTCQFRRQACRAAAGPQQRPHRVAAGDRIDQPLQLLRQALVVCSQSLASRPAPAHAHGLGSCPSGLLASEFFQTGANGRPRHTGGCGYAGYPATPDTACFDCRPAAPQAFVEQRIKGDKLGLDGFGQGEVHHEAAVYHTSQTDHSILARRLSPPISFGRWATHPAPVSGGRATAGRPRQRTGDRGRRAQHPRPGRAARYRIQQRPLLTRAPAASGIVILNQRRRGNHQ